jgi:glycosyltransferase involved in cell wall biosynthesis
MLDLLKSQRARGCTVELSCPEPAPGASTSLAHRAHDAGVTPVLELSRARGVSWWRDRIDARRLADVVREVDFDIVHCWHTRDHVLAIRALAARRRAGVTRLVRSYRNAEVISAWPWNRWLFGSGTDALLCVSPGTAEKNGRLRKRNPLLGAVGAVDLVRFQPRAPNASVRESLGLRPEHRVIGIVARIQRQRRFELLLAAMSHLAKRDKSARLLVIGRGTHGEEVAKIPAARLGISDRVVFAGYREADYVDTLCAVDIVTLVAPGSDGTCRALLEAAACGLPAVVIDRGALSEIVVDGETGLVAGADPAALSAGWQRLLDDASLRASMGAAARRRAQIHFSPARLAEQVEDLYRARGESGCGE